MRLLALSTLLSLTLALPAEAKLGDCGQPRSEGDRPTVGDVLYMMGAALHHRDCPVAICDVDDDCRVTLQDAFVTLRHALTGNGELSCKDECPVREVRCGDARTPTCGGVCPDEFVCRDVERKIPVCHVPGGDRDKAHTIYVDRHSIKAHLHHGDRIGRCRDRCERDGRRCGDADQKMKKKKKKKKKHHKHGWKPWRDSECLCVPDPSSTTTTTVRNSTTTTTTTTVRPPEGDADNDGIEDANDPCLKDTRNLCVGDVAVDATTGNDIRLNAGVGGGACSGVKTDCNGDLWNMDFGYNQAPSATGCTAEGGCPIAGVDALFGCTDESTQDLFRCEHWDAAALPELEYSFDVPDGKYVVNVFFANTFADTAAVGKRVVNIVIEGVLVYASFDQMAAAGGATQTAVVRSAVVAVDDDNGLQLSFGHVIENPAIKAIEVLSADTP